jgi:hypothetical protein
MTGQLDIPEPALAQAVTDMGVWASDYLDSLGKKDNIDGVLYHYTSAEGFKGIIESDSIWLTSIANLNDPSEFLHGLDIAKELVTAASKHADRRVGFFFDQIPGGLSKIASRRQTYIASFSRHQNDLGQWRSYASDGKGISIGFSAQAFSISSEPALELPVPQRCIIASVDYNRDSIKAKQAAAINKSIALLERSEVLDALDPDNFKPFFVEMSVHLCTVLMWNSLIAKHTAYEHEREVRLILYSHHRDLQPFIKTRIRGSEIVSYIPTPFMPVLKTPGSLTEVMLGPAAPLGSLAGVLNILKAGGIDTDEEGPVRVYQSDTPYRSLT